MKTVLITGISRGIGKALAQKFLRSGYFVIGTSTSGKCDLADLNLVVFQLDLKKKESIDACVEEIHNLDKKIDILINNAGVWIDPDTGPDINIDLLRQTLEVNLIGPIDFTQKILSLINKDGHIVNISSRQGSLGHASNTTDPSYRISKAALNMFTRILSIHLDGTIIVSSVHPGWVRTDMGGKSAAMSPEEAARYIYDLAISKPETGQFWFKGEKFPW